MSARTNPFPSASDATFLGWQENPLGEDFALFNIIAPGHPSYGSTVSARELERLHLRIPSIPDDREDAYQLHAHEASG